VEDRKSRSSDYFSVVVSLSVYMFDLAFAYDIISILLVVLFFFFLKNNKKKMERICRIYFLLAF
jgi:hypothetical protein